MTSSQTGEFSVTPWSKTAVDVIPPPPTAFPADLFWLADAPLFIDSGQVELFYDAVVRPETKEGPTTLQVTEKTARNLSGKIKGGGEVSPSAAMELLMRVFPFLKFKLQGEAERAVSTTTGTDQSRTIQLFPISNPSRQLVQLAIHYLLNLAERLFWVDDLSQPEWRDPQEILRSPRALAFLDLPPGTKFIPTAAEFANGKIVPLFVSLTKKCGERPPPYPEPEDYRDTNELHNKRKAYWAWFNETFNGSQAMRVVEDAASTNGRIHWIDYRLPLTAEADSLHLHLCPSGKYDTGAFAYNFIKRGFKHGMRLVGTLKSEPDMNVLAIYEK
jgi:hypothetical protein